jgi:hypothetical protein
VLLIISKACQCIIFPDGYCQASVHNDCKSDSFRMTNSVTEHARLDTDDLLLKMCIGKPWKCSAVGTMDH